MSERMSQSSLKSDWVRKSERFARDRARIKQILFRAKRPLDMAEIYPRFKEDFRYLPDIERRMRELVKRDEVTMYEGSIRKYELAKG